MCLMGCGQEFMSFDSGQIMSVPIPRNLIRRDRNLIHESTVNGQTGASDSSSFFFALSDNCHLSY